MQREYFDWLIPAGLCFVTRWHLRTHRLTGRIRTGRIRVATGLLLMFLGHVLLGPAAAEDRPNILWITSEDNGPQLGCYGDSYATTPCLDELADRGVAYTNVWSTAPVCAPARTCLITGMYPNSLGAHHMRSMVPLPPDVKLFPQLMREHGYYCSNRRKEDYNVPKTGQVWDDSSGQAHWRNRDGDQPFFAVFNFTVTHESQIRKRPHQAIHDPAQVAVPDYHPDHAAVRRDWAQYYDKLTEMDRQAGEILDQLNRDGLQDDTIIFYFADHGPGMPRNKRWPCNAGLNVPLILHIPDKFQRFRPAGYQPGKRLDHLIGFVDFAPTILELAGIKPLDSMQGHSFLGHRADSNSFIFGFRDRMDERHDMIRTIRNKRYVLTRNYSPQLIYGQHLFYQRQTPTDRVWRELFDRGELNDRQAFFWKPKPTLEMYDLQADPHEVNNLLRPDQDLPVEDFIQLRLALDRWLLGIRDCGFFPEAEMHRRCLQVPPRQFMKQLTRQDFVNLRDAAARASDALFTDKQVLADYLTNPEPAIRYWGLVGILVRNQQPLENNPAMQQAVVNLLHDDSPSVAIAAAETVIAAGIDDPSAVQQAKSNLLDFANLQVHSVYTCVEALNAIDRLAAHFAASREQLENLPRQHDKVHGRMDKLVQRLLENILTKL